jgi:hypothetical protein
MKSGEEPIDKPRLICEYAINTTRQVEQYYFYYRGCN